MINTEASFRRYKAPLNGTNLLIKRMILILETTEKLSSNLSFTFTFRGILCCRYSRFRITAIFDQFLLRFNHKKQKGKELQSSADYFFK
jgi:hypothetical protein